MRISLIAVGPIKRGPERELVDLYLDRFRKTARPLGFRGLEEIETPAGGGADREAARLVDKLPAGARILRLDERGPALRSDAFAQKLASLRDGGAADLAFFIGGADGYGDAAIKAAPDTLSLGPLTLPHRLARVILAEQLYRAASILAGAPYHKD